jgi:FolB domain-containing protein
MKEFLITHLDELTIDTKIGISEDERSKPQRIKISFTLYQKNLAMFKNDDSTKYNCYAKLAKLVEEYCTSRSFRIVEYLCYQLHKLIKENVSQDTFVSVEVRKNNLAYEGLRFNARAEYSDL